MLSVMIHEHRIFSWNDAEVSVFFTLDLYIFIINRRSKLVIFEQNTDTLNGGKTRMVVKVVEITRRSS